MWRMEEVIATDETATAEGLLRGNGSIRNARRRVPGHAGGFAGTSGRGMLGQIAPGLRLQESHQVADFDKELIFGAFLRGERAGIAFEREFFNAVTRGFIGVEGKNLLRGRRRQTSAQRCDDAPEQFRGS